MTELSDSMQFAPWPRILPAKADIPMRVRGARDCALARLFDYLSEITWRRSGPKGGCPIEFSIPRSSMFVEQPDSEVELTFPAIGVLPGKTIPEPPLMLGGPAVLDDTFGRYGKDSVLVDCGEVSEDVTLDVWVNKMAERRAIAFGVEGPVFRGELGSLYLPLPAYFGQVAVFTYSGCTRIDGDPVQLDRRELHVHLNLRVGCVFLVQANEFDPHVVVESV